ncbi:hypothetical protein SAMN05444392_11175 [Seinonella peptonophila]|uniref:Phage transcriptional activator, RinA family n=1 Tax=Seinonella peptonophila TaxID=112248 RepID=A0A1M4ZZY8_9BACL|nr:hypothetical protein [Seinonella peptonophila]SHF23613.1 hypothetical protein SAMN05444392_11175 [Seinonella peptonophila]
MKATKRNVRRQKPEWRRKVEWMLEVYPQYQQALKKWHPSLVSPVIMERVDGGNYKSSITEKIALIHAEQQQLIKQVEYALSLLLKNELQVITTTYFPVKIPVIIVCSRLHYSERKYYYLKEQAFRKMAMSLGLLE